MTDSVNTRELILGILLEVEAEKSYSHLVIRSVLEKYQYLDKRERAFITRVAEGTIQRRIELDYIIDQFSKVKTKKLKPVIREILRMGVYQLKYMDAVPASAACNEAVKLAKRKGFAQLGGFVNGVLRSISRGLTTVTYPDEEKEPVRALSVRYSMPEWIVERWLSDYGSERTKEILGASLAGAPLTIRTNLSRITPEALMERLAAEGVSAEPLDAERYPGLSYAFVISGFDYLNGLSCFREGLFYVQDISSMLVAEYAAPKPGDICLDVCAAPGGKSIHLAEKLGGTGKVIARDISAQKVALIEENIARCGLDNITAECLDATVYDAASAESADVVIADLPCSGLGVLRRKTDIKYRTGAAECEALAALQRQILSAVCGYVKPGGTLIYSTCTVNRAENEDNAAWFAAEHPEYELDVMRQMFPEEASGDGFFIAKFKKKAGV